jgi:8-oxo-dGTP pyrophosphatase MutT (NUDIX family)
MGEPESPPAAPAATVIVLRDAAEGLEVLMVKRSAHGAFAGHWAFPGGKVDPVDRDGEADELTAARRAARREAAEEAGLELDEHDFVTFAHWMPPPSQPKKFSTWFFAVTTDRHDVSIDGHEIDDHVWVRPADALGRRDAGEIELAAPTWMTLHQLSVQPDASAFLDWARAMAAPPRFHTRHVDDDAGVRVLLWAPDAAYDSFELDAPGPRNRLYQHPGRWVVEQG